MYRDYNLEFGQNYEDRKNNLLFIPHKKESAVDIVINNIKRLLLSKKLLPGDRLPNEMELSKALSVSRGSVREAMKIFSAFGIVEVRQGDGTYVSRSVGNVLFDPLMFSFILSQPDVEELSEFRQIIELEVVKLIIENADEEDIKRIEDVHLDLENKIKSSIEDPAVLSKCDIEFHRALGQATKNRLVERVYAFVVDFYTPSIEKNHENQKSGLAALKAHKGILEALINNDLQMAIKAIEASVKAWKGLL